MGENTEKDTIYLTSEQLGEEPEILFQEEISGILQKKQCAGTVFHGKPSLSPESGAVFPFRRRAVLLCRAGYLSHEGADGDSGRSKPDSQNLPGRKRKKSSPVSFAARGRSFKLPFETLRFPGTFGVWRAVSGNYLFFGWRMETGAGAAGKDKKRKAKIERH